VFEKVAALPMPSAWPVVALLPASRVAVDRAAHCEDADTLRVAVAEPLAVREATREGDAAREGETLVERVREALTEAVPSREAESETEGEAPALGETEAVAVADAATPEMLIAPKLMLLVPTLLLVATKMRAHMTGMPAAAAGSVAVSVPNYVPCMVGLKVTAPAGASDVMAVALLATTYTWRGPTSAFRFCALTESVMGAAYAAVVVQTCRY